MDLSNNLDEMTLRLMSNKKGLKTYLKQNDEDEYKKINYEEEIIDLHREEILSVTYNMLNKKNNDYSSDIIKSFNVYVKNIVNRIELSKIETSNEYNKEDDVIFSNMDGEKKTIPNIFGYSFERKI